MRITYQATYDIETGQLESWTGDLGYTGQVAQCKGSHSSAEQTAADSQRAMENQLMQQQLAMQQKQLADVNAVADPIIAAGGLAPGIQAALTSLAMNQLPQDFQNTMAGANTAMLRRGITGGNMAGSGDIARSYGQLGAMQDIAKSNLLSNIQLQKQAGLEQMLGLKMGIAGSYGQNVGGFNQGAGSALGAGVNAAYNADQMQTSWLGPLLGGLMGVGSSFLPGGSAAKSLKLFGG